MRADQPMAIAYDSAPPPGRGPRRTATAPASLLNRIEKPPLLDRISKTTEAKSKSVSPSYVASIRIRDVVVLIGLPLFP